MSKTTYIDYGYLHKLPRDNQIELRRQLGKPLNDASILAQHLFFACLSNDEETQESFKKRSKFDDTFLDRLFLSLCAAAFFCEVDAVSTDLSTYLHARLKLAATESMRNRIIGFCSCDYAARGQFSNAITGYLLQMKKDGMRIRPATFEDDVLRWGDEKFDTRVKYGKALAEFAE